MGDGERDGIGASSGSGDGERDGIGVTERGDIGVTERDGIGVTDWGDSGELRQELPSSSSEEQRSISILVLPESPPGWLVPAPPSSVFEA